MPAQCDIAPMATCQAFRRGKDAEGRSLALNKAPEAQLPTQWVLVPWSPSSTYVVNDAGTYHIGDWAARDGSGLQLQMRGFAQKAPTRPESVAHCQPNTDIAQKLGRIDGFPLWFLSSP